jgi:succinoglycan biosynthesis transport protein ExoP
MKFLMAKYGLALRKRAWMLVVIVMIALTTSYGMTKTVAPEFQASSKILIVLKPSLYPEFFMNEVLGYQKFGKTYTEIIKSSAVAKEVIDRMHLKMTPQQLSGMVSVSGADTQVLTLTVTSGDGKLAAELADQVALAFVDKVGQLMQVDNVQVLEKAGDRPPTQTKPNLKMNLMMAFSLSFLVGLTALLVREYLDPSLKHRDEVRDVLGLALIGEIGVWKGMTGGRARGGFGRRREEAAGLESSVLQMYPSKQNRMVLENYQALYRNLIPLSILQELKTILVTSTVHGEGKTAVLTHFGILLAQSGQRVLLIDGDLDKPGLHQVFGLPNVRGLCEVLTEALPWESAVTEVRIQGLSLLTTGQVTHEALRRLREDGFGALMQELRGHYDVVLIDSSAMEESLVPLLLAPKVDGVLHVVGSSIVHRQHAVLAVEALRSTGARLLGGVLNNLEGKTRRPRFFLERKWS